VELAFEGHRYWDLRRWRIAKDVIPVNRSGLRYILDYNTRKYQVKVLENYDGVTPPVFENRNYYSNFDPMREGYVRTNGIQKDKVYTLSTSVQTKTMEKLTTQTKDGQWLNTNIDVKYKVNKEKAMTVFSNYTTLENVNDSVVSPAVQRAIESVTGNYDIYDILGNKRTEVYEMIDKALKEKFESYDLEFVSFTITDQDAGDEIEAAIKNESVKQKEIDTAKQEQEKAKVEADTKKVQAQAEADTAVIKAEGEAKANKTKSDSITDNLIRMKEAEAREKHGWVTVNGAGSVITNP